MTGLAAVAAPTAFLPDGTEFTVTAMIDGEVSWTAEGVETRVAREVERASAGLRCEVEHLKARSKIAVLDRNAPMRLAKASALPQNLPPFTLNRAEAAAYVGVSPNIFDAMVKKGDMPRPRAIGARRLWIRDELERAARELPSDDDRDASEGKSLLDKVLGT
jgi:predicted DNA-binding transcriptional regulator AlpA